MNNSSNGVSTHYLQAINRYITAIEKGDLEIVAAVLHEAEDDADLEQMLLEISAVYQVDDHSMPDYSEIAEARSILQATVHSHFAEATDVDSTLESKQMIMDKTTSTKATSTISSLKLSSLLTALTRSGKHDLSISRATTDTPTHLKPISAFLQTLAAILVVAVLLTSFIALFASRHTQSGGPLVQVADGQVAAAITSDGTISTFNATTGATLWTYKTHQMIINDETGLVIKNLVLYALANGHVYALRLTNGSPLWQYYIPLIPPTYLAFGKRFVLNQGIIYISETGSDPQEKASSINTFYGHLYAIRARDGKLLWRYNSNTYPFLDVNNGVVHVVQQEGNMNAVTIQALRGTDRKVLWTKSHLGNVAAIGTDSTLYTVSVSQNSGNSQQATLQAIKNDGSLAWSRSLHYSVSGRVYINSNTLIYGSGLQFCAYRQNNGTQKWCIGGSGLQQPAPYPNSTLTDSTLYSITTVVNGKSNAQEYTRIAAYQVSNGKVLWSKQYPGLSVSAEEPIQPVISQDVMVINLAGSIYALSSINGHELWHAGISRVNCVTIGQ